MITSYEFLATWLRAHHDDRGASVVEYALLLGMIAIVCIGAVTFLGNHTSSELDNVGQSLAAH